MQFVFECLVSSCIIVGVLDLDVTRYQQASSPIQGNYTISFKAVTTSPLMHNASSSEVRYIVLLW